MLRGLFGGRDLDRPVEEAVLDGMTALDVHADVPDNLRALAQSGVRVVTLTNGSLSQTEGLLARADVEHLVERRLLVDDAGR